jgi:hypothetical protein
MGLIPLKESLMFRLEERCSSHFQGVDFRFTTDFSTFKRFLLFLFTIYTFILPSKDTSTYKRCPLTSSHVTAWGLFFSKGNGQRAPAKPVPDGDTKKSSSWSATMSVFLRPALPKRLPYSLSGRRKTTPSQGQSPATIGKESALWQEKMKLQ